MQIASITIMIVKKHLRNPVGVVVFFTIVISIGITGMTLPTTTPVVIVFGNSTEEILALQTLQQFVPNAIIVKHNSFQADLYSFKTTSMIFFIGRGSNQGILTQEGVLSWESIVMRYQQQAKLSIFLSCQSPRVVTLNGMISLGMDGSLVDAVVAGSIAGVYWGIYSQNMNIIRTALDSLKQRSVQLVRGEALPFFLADKMEINEWLDNVNIVQDVYFSFFLDKVFDIAVTFLALVAAGKIVAGAVGAGVSTVLKKTFINPDTLIDAWNAYSTIKFFKEEVGLEVYLLNPFGSKRYDFYMTYAEPSGFAWVTKNGVRVGAIGTIITYMEIWDKDRTQKIALVRQESTLAASIMWGTMYSVDLFATAIDWDLVEKYPAGGGGGNPFEPPRYT